MFGHDIHTLQYHYWGRRLADLHEFMLNRPPRNSFERWMKWRASESNAFAIALAALAISTVVGVVTVALAAVQTWITWKAWREPVGAPRGNDGAPVITLPELIEWARQYRDDGQRRNLAETG